MSRIVMLALLLAGLSTAAVSQTGGDATTDTAKRSAPGAADKQRPKSSSSINTPVTGEPTGRNNPSISTAPDTAPAGGTARPQ